MNDIFENKLKFIPDYNWTEPETERKVPRYHQFLELVENRPTYYGKPWWCYRCQWQFSEQDFPEMKCESTEE